MYLRFQAFIFPLRIRQLARNSGLSYGYGNWLCGDNIGRILAMIYK